MSLIIKQETKRTIPLLDAGDYQSVCCAVIDLGTQYNEKWEKMQQKLLIMWDIAGETIEIDGEQKPRRLSKQYTKSLNEKSALARDINNWRGKPFTEEELHAFDLTKLINTGCQINVAQDTKDGKTYTYIMGIMNLPKGTKLEPISEPILYDIDNHNENVFCQLPEWVQTIIKNSEEWKTSHQNNNDEDLPF